ncbi:MAG TPA: hypothetical protein PKO38_01570 [Bacillota bacterium]|nr:hypothetical protein [Bacillota bacterium]HOB86362.1 hypothetical protein [Bacillota bacterium]HOP68531.1 hypothetical protein [Bacillota bacterium]HPT33240.1 hypothetical protein [Bacillota bacterium]HPZ64492.1 hypothetical protein [Bacillota bacterium]
MKRRIFYAVPFRRGLILVPLVFLGLGLLGWGGWHIFARHLSPSFPQAVQKGIAQSLEDLDSYYVKFKTTLLYLEEQPSYLLEIWGCPPKQYRCEMIRLKGDRQAALQVMIHNQGKDYYFDPELGDFLPVHELGREQLPYKMLEEYWHSVTGAAEVQLLQEQEGSRHRYYILEVIPDQPHRHRVKELIWVESKRLLPVRVEVYDLNGTLTQLTTFEVIQLNPVLEASLFSVEFQEVP